MSDRIKVWGINDTNKNSMIIYDCVIKFLFLVISKYINNELKSVSFLVVEKIRIEIQKHTYIFIINQKKRKEIL